MLINQLVHDKINKTDLKYEDNITDSNTFEHEIKENVKRDRKI